MPNYPLIAGAFAAGIAAIGGLGFGVNQSSEVESLRKKLDTALMRAEDAEKRVAEIEQSMIALQNSSLAAEQDSQVSRAQFETNFAQRSEAIAAQFDALIENGNQSLNYIDQLETKLRSGQQLAKSEVETLGAIASSIDQLGKRYAAPMQEFAEMSEYFAEQADGDSVDQPNARFRRLKSIFSPAYREHKLAAAQAQGRQQAYEEANERYQAAYRTAQAKMAAASREMSGHAQRLFAMANQKDINPDELEAFFKESREAIKVHLDVLEFDFEPEMAGPERPLP